jgi:hypothetical protein
MNWRTKAFIQNAISKLPSKLSYAAYYRMQRRFGGLREVNPTTRLQAGVEVVNRIEAQGLSVEGKTFFEVGTGRMVALPMALSLCGAKEVITVDLNPYLQHTLVSEQAQYMKGHCDEIRTLFGAHTAKPEFEDKLKAIFETGLSDVPELLERLGIRYLAPADATTLNLSTPVDYHVSFTVLEHVPPTSLKAIFVQGLKQLSDGGLFIHHIDFADHFARTDSSITTVNFLQFTEKEWLRFAGNRYMYHNRLRVDEFREVIEDSGL